MNFKPILAAGLLLAAVSAGAQDASLKVWTLEECIAYADTNNISLKMSRNTYASGLESTGQAKAAMLPSVSANVSQGVSNSPAAGTTSYNGSYGISAGMTLWNGGRLRNSLLQQQALNTVDSLSVEENRMSLKADITQAYINCLYAAESVKAAESSLEASKAQRDRAEQLLKVGTISKVDFAQLQSQYVSEQYKLTTAQNSHATCLLQLKQLLELDIMDEILLADFEADESEVLAPIPDKAAVYADAMNTMPQVLSGEYSTKAAEYSLKQAEAGMLPSVGLNAGVQTGNGSVSSESFGTQLGNNFGESIGLSVSIPIFSNRQNRTAVNKARLALENTRLSQRNTEKTVLKAVESAYLDATAAQLQYVAAREKEKYARESYDLTYEQFGVGRKNTVELITAQNELTSAVQGAIQAKYTALMNRRILEIYQGKI